MVSEADILAFLERKYTHRADARQREMGLKYINAETHDLAHELSKLFLPKRRVRHLKRGTTYQVLGEAEAQISKPTLSTKGRLLTEGEKLTVYQADEDGKLWVRFPDEFEDGRFEEIA